MYIQKLDSKKITQSKGIGKRIFRGISLFFLLLLTGFIFSCASGEEDDKKNLGDVDKPTCVDGKILGENNVCVDDIPKCEANEIPDSKGGCIEDPTQCEANEISDGKGGCIEDPTQCKENEISDGKGGCIEDPTQCEANEISDGKGGCIEDPIQCEANEISDGKGGCIPNVPECDNDKIRDESGNCVCTGGKTVDGSGNCVCTGGKVDDGSGNCVCTGGKIDDGSGNCVCTGGKVDDGSGNCVCTGGKVDDGSGNCVCTGGKVDDGSGNCVCTGGKVDDGSGNCVCTGGKVDDGSGNCVCTGGKVDDGSGNCVCTGGKVDDGSGNCVCTGGKVDDGSGNCVCTGGKVDDGSGNCVCTGGKIDDGSGNCVCTGGKVDDGSGNCVCTGGKIDDGSGNCVCTGGKIDDGSGNCVCTGDKIDDGSGNCVCTGDKIDDGSGNCVCAGGKTDDGSGNCVCPSGTVEKDGSCQTLSNEKSFTSIGFHAQENPLLNGDYAGNISSTSVSVSVKKAYFSPLVNSLKPYFTVSDGATVKVNGEVQTSGVSEQDFTSSVTYQVIAEDGTSKNYSVRVTSTKESKHVTDFSDTSSTGLQQISSMTSLTIGDNGYLYVASFKESSISVYKFSDTQSPTFVEKVNDTIQNALGGVSALLAQKVGQNYFLFAGSKTDNGVSVFKIASDGKLTHRMTIFDDNSNYISDVSDFAFVTLGSSNYLFVSSYFESGFTMFKVLSTGDISAMQSFSDNDNFDYTLNWITSLDVVKSNNKSYLVVSGEMDEGLSAFLISSGGTLYYKSNVMFEAGLSQVSDTSIVTNSDGSFIITAGKGDSSVGVFAIDNLEKFNTIGSMNDSFEYKFSGANSLAQIEVDQKNYFVVTGYYDNGFSVLKVLSNGGLVHEWGIDDFSGNYKLQKPVSPTFVTAGEKTFLVVAGYSESGFSVFQ